MLVLFSSNGRIFEIEKKFAYFTGTSYPILLGLKAASAPSFICVTVDLRSLQIMMEFSGTSSQGVVGLGIVATEKDR